MGRRRPVFFSTRPAMHRRNNTQMCINTHHAFCRQTILVRIYSTKLIPYTLTVVVKKKRTTNCLSSHDDKSAATTLLPLRSPHLHPSVGGEREPFELLREEFDHVRALRLTVHEDVDSQGLLRTQYTAVHQARDATR